MFTFQVINESKIDCLIIISNEKSYIVPVIYDYIESIESLDCIELDLTF